MREIISLIHVLEKRNSQNKTQLRYNFGSVYNVKVFFTLAQLSYPKFNIVVFKDYESSVSLRKMMKRSKGSVIIKDHSPPLASRGKGVKCKTRKRWPTRRQLVQRPASRAATRKKKTTGSEHVLVRTNLSLGPKVVLNTQYCIS